MVEELLKWYALHRRMLPWRTNPTPYAVWVSEIMCQQTRIETVLPYYERFMNRLPTIADLAQCPEEELLKLWEGLGYYSRARHMKEAAMDIMSRFAGSFPSDFDDVLSLKGIGVYTAGAILSIAFEKKYAAVDGNVLRVFSRFWMDDHDIASEETKKNMKYRLEQILPDAVGDFNQAIMDLGATICIPNGIPLCEKCPLSSECQAYQNSCVSDYPRKSKTSAKKEIYMTVLLIEVHQRYVIRKREDQTLLKGLYEFVHVDEFSPSAFLEKYPSAKIERRTSRVHIFTHQKWYMDCYYICCDHIDLKDNEKLVSKEELSEKYSMPKAFSRFLKEL